MNNFFKHLFNVLFQGARFILKFLTEAVGLLTSSTQTTKPGDALKDSLNGGELNYRAGKLDDGTDPAGWYEDD